MNKYRSFQSSRPTKKHVPGKGYSGISFDFTGDGSNRSGSRHTDPMRHNYHPDRNHSVDFPNQMSPVKDNFVSCSMAVFVCSLASNAFLIRDCLQFCCILDTTVLMHICQKPHSFHIVPASAVNGIKASTSQPANEQPTTPTACSVCILIYQTSRLKVTNPRENFPFYLHIRHVSSYHSGPLFGSKPIRLPFAQARAFLLMTLPTTTYYAHTLPYPRLHVVSFRMNMWPALNWLNDDDDKIYASYIDIDSKLTACYYDDCIFNRIIRLAQRRRR